MRVLVTGAAGFLGSHLVDQLLAEGDLVTGVDAFTTGFREFLAGPLGEDGTGRGRHFTLVETDLRRPLPAALFRDQEAVFHLAANADVRGGVADPHVDFELNVRVTHELLEALRRSDVERFVFTSSAVVYGEPSQIPTPEDYRGRQTSLYGASKVAAEALVEAYANYYGLRAQVFRLVSLLGERYTHGVVFDFVKKLQADPSLLEILGDGRQQKSYLYVEDAVDGMLLAFRSHPPAPGEVDAYNLGHDQVLTAREIADLVCSEMGIGGTRYRYSGGARGWPGDSPSVLLDTQRLQELGWRPRLSVQEAVRRTVRFLLEHPNLLAQRPAGGPLPERGALAREPSTGTPPGTLPAEDSRA